jgi:hypothetical protein
VYSKKARLPEECAILSTKAIFAKSASYRISETSAAVLAASLRRRTQNGYLKPED